MKHTHRISIGMNLDRPMWRPEYRIVFERDTLTEDESIRYIKGTAIISTSRPAKILQSIAAYAEGNAPAIRWMNVGPAEDKKERAA